MSASLAANECRRQLRYNYTPDERIAKSISHATVLNDIDRTNADLDRIKADFKARLSALEAEESQLRGCVTNGYELREYLCRWSYDEPTKGRKTLRKVESGEVVTVEDMTERDRQMVMEIIDAQTAVAQAAAPAEKLALPVVSMPRTVEDVTLSEDVIMSFEFTAGECLSFSDRFLAVFAFAPEADEPGYILRGDESRDAELSKLLTDRDSKWLTGFAQWLREDTRSAIPGASWLADAVEAHLRGEKSRADAAKAKEAAAKKEARKGRRASGAGTVEVEADEGTRDDSGPDSKNDL